MENNLLIDFPYITLDFLGFKGNSFIQNKLGFS